METTIETIEKDIKEIKILVERLCYTLGVGQTPPSKVVDLKERAKKKAITLKQNVNSSKT